MCVSEESTGTDCDFVDCVRKFHQDSIRNRSHFKMSVEQDSRHNQDELQWMTGVTEDNVKNKILKKHQDRDQTGFVYKIPQGRNKIWTGRDRKTCSCAPG